MSVYGIVLHAHEGWLGALRWSKAGQILHYPICNPAWYLGPLDVDEWLDRWCYGTSVRIYCGRERDHWIDVLPPRGWRDT